MKLRTESVKEKLRLLSKVKTHTQKLRLKEEEDETHGLQSKRCETLGHDRQAGWGVRSLTHTLKLGKGEKQQTQSRKTSILRSWRVLVNCVCPVFKLSCVQRYQGVFQVRAE